MLIVSGSLIRLADESSAGPEGGRDGERNAVTYMAYEYQVKIYCRFYRFKLCCSHTSAQLNYDKRHNRAQTVAHK